MSSFIDDGWGDDEDLDVSVTSLGGDGWGEDDDLFGDDGGDKKEDDIPGFPPAAPTIAPSNPISEVLQSNNNQEKTKLESDYPAQSGTGSACVRHRETATTTTRSHNAPMQQPRHIPAPNDFNLESNSMVTELSKYITSLNRMLSSINAVLDFEYNTCQKAEELLEYYKKRPQLAEYTRTKELQRMNYEVVLPDGYVETNKERIIGENLLPDNSIVSRAANQSLLADILQVITGHDLIVRPQYLTVCIATWCKFVIHNGDHGADMIDCRANLSLFLPTTEGDRLSIAEVTVSVIFSPSQPMIEFKVIKIEVLLKDFSKLVGVADFLSAMGCNNEDHEVIDASPDIYRDAFLEKSQRFVALSSEGMKSAFQQMDSVINFKGKIKSISNFIPDGDQMLAAEQEAISFAEARKKELQLQQQRKPIFPRPPPTQAPNRSRDQTQNTLNIDKTNRPKSILGGLVRSGWKTLANSVTIPDDDPAIYGEPSLPTRAPLPDQQMMFYRKNDDAPDEGQSRYKNDVIQNVPIPNQGHKSEMHYQRKGDTKMRLQSSNMSDIVREIGTSDHNSFGLHTTNHHLKSSVNVSVSASGTSVSSQSNPHGLTVTDREMNDVQSNNNRIEKSLQPDELPGLSTEVGEAEVHEDFGDGWDDDFEGLDDVSDNLEEFSDQHKISSEQYRERGKTLASFSDDGILDSIIMTEESIPSCDTKFDEDDDVCDTRRRWVNPRPHRPYLKY